MNLLSLYRTGGVIAYLKPDTNSELEQVLMESNLIKLSFAVSAAIDIAVGDYILFNGQKYELLNPSDIQVMGATSLKYTVKLYGPEWVLSKTSFLLGYDFSFDLTATAADVLNLCVANLNRDHAGYTAGNCDNTEAFTFTFDNLSVLDAIKQAKEQLGFEFWLEGKTLHFTKYINNTGLTLAVGCYAGLYDLSVKRVESAEIVTSAWCYGSSENLPSDYSGPLVYTRLAFANAALGNQSRVENNTALFGLREKVVLFDDVKPEYRGSITHVFDNIYQFRDQLLDFYILDCLAPGLSAKINMLSGACMGMTFEISDHNQTVDIYTIVPFTDDSGTYPNETLKLAVGDQYTIIDIIMPQRYVTDAEVRLRTKADEWITKNSVPQVFYELTPDPKYLRERGIPALGDTITVNNIALGVAGDLRITAVKQNIVNPYIAKYEVGDFRPKTLIQALKQGGNSTDLSNYYNKQQTNQQIELKGGVIWE